MSDIHGNIEGLRDTFLQQMETLYDAIVPADQFCPPELAELLANWSAKMNREVAVYVTRDGEIADIIIGNNDSVALPDLHLRRSTKRLSMVRCIHTHPGGSGMLSDVDESALRSLRFDAMCAIGVDKEGHPVDVSCGFLDQMNKNLRMNEIRIDGPMPCRHLPQTRWMEAIEEADVRSMIGMEDVTEGPERVMLVGMDSDESLDELARLAETAGAVVVDRVLQHKVKPDTATYIGSGKAAGLCLDCQALGIDTVIVDEELTGIQLRNLEQMIGVKVVDRTTLILDIFAQRAQSREGKLQVELAQLQYQSARLIGQGLVLSRLAGGIGTRGPGESKLEMNRRRIRERVTALRRELSEVEKQRSVRRKAREKNKVPTAALVGYTNVGKSSLLNLISGAGVYVENQLFATLDAVSRLVTLPSGRQFLLTDTVGFIKKLPTALVNAFHATLEEAALADVLLIVSDAACAEQVEQHRVVEQVLDELGATSQPRIEVINKCDLCPAGDLIPGAVGVSAIENTGIEELLSAIEKALFGTEEKMAAKIPYDKMNLLQVIRSLGVIESEEYGDDGEIVIFKIPVQEKDKLLHRLGEDMLIPMPE